MPINPSTLAGLQGIASTPLARAAVRYWWVTIPIGLAAYRSWQRRKAKEGSAHPLDVLLDVAPLIGLVSTAILLNEKVGQMEARQAQAAAPRPKPSPIPPGAPVTDADFTPRPEARHARLAAADA